MALHAGSRRALLGARRAAHRRGARVAVDYSRPRARRRRGALRNKILKADFFGMKVGFTIFNQAAHTGISSMAALLPLLVSRNFDCSGTQCQTPGRLFINFQSLGIRPALLDAALFRRLRPAAAAAAHSAHARSRGAARASHHRRAYAYRRPHVSSASCPCTLCIWACVCGSACPRVASQHVAWHGPHPTKRSRCF